MPCSSKWRKSPDDTKGVAHSVGIAGMSWLAQATSPNFASMFIVLEAVRRAAAARIGPTRPSWPICGSEWRRQIKDAVVTVFGASPVPGIGLAGGFKMMVEDRGGLGLPALAAADRHAGSASCSRKCPAWSACNTQFRSNTPQLFMDIDRKKAAAMGVSLNDVNQTLEIYLGSLYVNSFNDFGRHWQVTIQADGQFRNRVDRRQLVPSAQQSGSRWFRWARFARRTKSAAR